MAYHEEPQIAQHLLAAVPHGTYVECFADPRARPGLAGHVGQSLPAITDGSIELSSTRASAACSTRQWYALPRRLTRPAPAPSLSEKPG